MPTPAASGGASAAASIPIAAPSPAPAAAPTPSPYVPPSAHSLADGTVIDTAVPGRLPEIPLVDGPLALRVVYPRVRQVISVRDSTFLLGSVGSGKARLTINGDTVAVNPNGGFLAWLPFPANDPPTYVIRAVRNGDSVTVVHPVARPRVPSTPPDPAPLVVPEVPTFVELLNANVDAKSDSDAVAILRPSIGGTYRWFLHPGTPVEVTATRGAWTRVSLDDRTEAWVESAATRPTDSRPPSLLNLGGARVEVHEGSSDFRLPMPGKVPFLVEQDADSLALTFYGVSADVGLSRATEGDPTVASIESTVTEHRLRLLFRLRRTSVGYETLWDNGEFVLRARRVPVVDRERPLAGRLIAVDAGHPPIGSTGPTGLYEGDATLLIATQLKRLLEAAGATVLMTRTTSAAVAIGDRPIMARRANADALVSIHLNALPDGVNPYRTNGTSTYLFHAQSEPLARLVQRGMVRWMGLRDLGVRYDNLALARPTWFPSILCEGAFVILPDQEAALRTEEFQTRYAIGILEGLEGYFRSLAR